jgi:putative membrane protein
MLWKLKCVAVLALGTGTLAARADDNKPDDQPFDDATFVRMAAIDGMTEVALGKIVAAQAKSDDVKKFAEKMVKDHTKADEQLKTAAKSAGLALPDAPDEKHQKHIDKFKNYKGTDFDTDYIKFMVDDHTKAVALFTRASKEAKNPAIKDFATQTLPVVQQHLDIAKKISNK